MTLFIKVYLRKQNCFMSLRVKQYYKVDINKNQSIKYNMHKIFKLHPLFFLVGLVFIILGQALAFLIYFLVVALHEFAHGFVAQKLGYGLNKIYLLPFGAMLDINQNFITREDEIKVALAGPICNFVLVFICLGIWWIFPETYAYTNFFVFCNIITGLVNLLPCYPMDGGRIMVAVLSEKFNREKSLKISYIFNYIFSFIFIVLFFINLRFEVNISYALMAIFIFFGTINNKFSGNYSMIKLEKNKNIYEVKSFLVKGDTPLYKILKHFNSKKFNIIYVELENGQIKMLTENLINKYFEIYPANTLICNILN